MINEINPGVVTLTDKAVERMMAQISSNSKAVGILLSAKESGCSGLMYNIEFLLENPSTDHILISTDANITVAVPKSDADYFSGLVVDVEIEGLNESFSFSNPKATAVCGCGMSFSTK